VIAIRINPRKKVKCGTGRPINEAIIEPVKIPINIPSPPPLGVTFVWEEREFGMSKKAFFVRNGTKKYNETEEAKKLDIPKTRT